jgi:hypothetical protein
MSAQLDAILEAVGAAPCLPGAKCRGRSSLFDAAADREPAEVVEARHALALDLCIYACPAIDKCQEWYESLPPRRRPAGVVAGEVRQGKQ